MERDSVSLSRRLICADRNERTGSLFSYVDIEGRLQPDHPLRAVRALTDETLAAMEREPAVLYSGDRPSIAPQMLLRAMLLQAFYSLRSERQLMERTEFDLLFRWFVGLGADEPVWGASTFSKNRDRSLRGRRGGADPGDADGSASGEAALVVRSLQRRWHDDPGVVVDEECQGDRARQGTR